VVGLKADIIGSRSRCRAKSGAPIQPAHDTLTSTFIEAFTRTIR